jgi:hypothetical protein
MRDWTSCASTRSPDLMALVTWRCSLRNSALSAVCPLSSCAMASAWLSRTAQSSSAESLMRSVLLFSDWGDLKKRKFTYAKDCRGWISCSAERRVPPFGRQMHHGRSRGTFSTIRSGQELRSLSPPPCTSSSATSPVVILPNRLCQFMQQPTPQSDVILPCRTEGSTQPRSGKSRRTAIDRKYSESRGSR